MAEQQKAKAKGLPMRVKAGSRSMKRARHFARALDRKLRHVLKRNGRAVAEQYAQAHQTEGGVIVLRRLTA